VAIVDYTVTDGIAHIVLNRPDVLNALTDDSIRMLRECFFQMEDDDDVLVGIISGNGRAFCAGGDIKQRHSKSQEERTKLGSGQARDARIEDIAYGYTRWKPLIAAVHGYCLGAGLYLALICEMIVASEDARFQLAEIKIGAEGGQFWHQLAFRANGGFATDVGITGRIWTAEEGMRNRAVDRVAPAGQHVEAAEELARTTIMKMPPLAVRTIVEHRRFVHEELYLKARMLRNRTLHLSDDFQEAAAAFREKRTPVFKGR